ncbi:MAG: lysophospholipid acyltransferase family protein [Acidobacteriota bacterium]
MSGKNYSVIFTAMKKFRKARFIAEFLFFQGVASLSSILPRKVVLFIGTLFGRIIYHLDRKRKRIGMENLKMAFGGSLTPRERKKIIKKVYIQMGRCAFDVFLFPRFTKESIGKTIFYEGLENIQRAYEKKRGVFLFSAHFGNWELVAHMQGHLGFPLMLVTRPLDNPYIERKIAQKYRTLSGNGVIHKKNAVREMLKAIARGLGIAIVIDQNVREKPYVFVDFFGIPAATTPSLSLLALKTGATIIPVFSVPRDDGTYRIIYEKEVEIINTGNREKDVLDIMQTCTKIIERYVREYPHLWMWMHQRWRTKVTNSADVR